MKEKMYSSYYPNTFFKHFVLIILLKLTRIFSRINHLIYLNISNPDLQDNNRRSYPEILQILFNLK